MSFTDDFLKELKKKNISITEQGPVGGNSYTKSYLDSLNDLEEERKKRQELMAAVSSPMSSTMDDIGPVAKTIGESKPDLFGLDFFQKGVFEDGYQAGDIAKSILGTATDFTMNIGKGALGLVEGIGDFVMHGAAYGADLLGAENAADKLHAGANKNVVHDLTKGASAWVDQYSVLGGTTDAFAQGIGNMLTLQNPVGWASKALNLGKAGTTAISTGAMFVSGAGSGVSEAYQGGATNLEALKHGLNSGAANSLPELIFGGLGKSINAVGFSKGLSSADDMLAKLASSKLKNQVAKNIVEFGIKSGAEGLEEVVTGIAQAYSKHNTYMSEKEFLDILADENLLEQFVVGAMTSGAMQSGAIPGTYQGSLIEANKQGKDFITGQTVNEQAVIKKEIEKRIAEQEKYGRKLTAREKSAIEAQVEADLPKGYISTDTIEEVLGGDDYKAYKDTIDSEEALKRQEKDLTAEYNMLNGKDPNTMTEEETARRNSLQSQISEIWSKIEGNEKSGKRNQMKAELTNKVYELSKSDRLVESYLEPVRAKQKFTADLSKYEGKAKEVIKQVMDSGLADNSNRTHDFWDLNAKLAAKLNTNISIASDQQIMEMVKAKYEAEGVEFDENQFKGQTIDGFISKDGIVLNAESKRALNFVVGHEITHELEQSNYYSKLQDALMKFAGKEFDSRFEKRMAQYKGKYSDAKLKEQVKREVTADLVGDYLFTDENFIKHLSSSDRNVFQKMYDEVKHLLKLATAGSKEARELERVKHLFDKALNDTAAKNNSDAGKNTETDADVTVGENGDTENGKKQPVKYSLGYHAGDLGKAESYAEQGGYRNTGHFGTGTYFVGDEAAISYGDYGKRPHHSVEFDNYNLYKARSDKDGYELHDQLRVIDGGFSQDFLDGAIADKFRLSELRNEAWELVKKYDKEEWDDELEMFISRDYIGSSIRACTEVAQANGIEVQSYDEWLAEQSDDVPKPEDSDYDLYKADYLDYLKDSLKEADAERNSGYEDFRDAYFQLWLRFGKDKTNRALQAVIEHDAAMNPDGWRDYDAQLKADSRATVFMKALGYEGVDVRGTSLDNTTYGSVIYDLKGEDAKRKAEIGTAKFAISDSEESRQADAKFSPDEIKAIQSIGRKSVNSFSSQDIAATEKFAKRYWNELGVKSPFYRAWFGDWRSNDRTPIQIATQQGDARGVQKNTDTGWDIQVSAKVFNETQAHNGSPNIAARPYLPYINDIVKNAVLFDSHGMKPGKSKSVNSLLMHSMYAVADIGNGPEVLKLYVEEMNNPNATTTTKRSYQLQNIEKYRPAGKSSQKTVSSISPVVGIGDTVADLFAFVKRVEKSFAPSDASKIVNADGTPKVMYHGSQAQFTVFDRSKAKSGGHYGKGFYFTDSTSHAGTYGNQYAVYLNIRNPLQSGTETVSRSQVRSYLEAVAENEDYSIENYGTYDIDEVLNIVMGKGNAADAFKVINDINATAIGDMVEAAELFNSVNGTAFDGIVVPTETVAFYPEQIKSATDNIGTFDKGNPDIRFALSDSVEETKDLMALHNLQASELLKSLGLGGLPMPSIAVIKAEAGHDKYGDVSLILPKNVIDPKANRYNKVYGGDAWTPTYPSIEYKVNEKAQKAIEKKIDGLVPYDVQSGLGRVSLDYDNMSRDINRYDGDMYTAYRYNRAMKYAFLVDSGYSEQLPMTEKALDGSGRFKNDFIVEVVEKLGASEVEKLVNERIYDNEALISELRNMANENARAKYADDSKVFKALFAKPLYTEQNFGFAQADSIIRAAHRYVVDGFEQTVDYKKATEVIDSAVDEAAYQEWINDLFSGIVEKEGIRNNADYFTPSGNRRKWEALHWENTLENVVKVMRGQEETGVGSLSPYNSFASLAQKKYGSIEEIKADSNRLSQIPEEEYEAMGNAFADRFAEITSSIKDPSERNRFIAMDEAAELIVDAVRTQKTSAGMLREMQKYNKRVTAQTVADIQALISDIANMPTGYFEAKPQRAVSFDEIGVFVIPRNADVKLKQELLNKGYSIAEYDPDVEGDRSRVVNGFEEYKFSLSNVGEEHPVYGSYHYYSRYKPTDIAPVMEAPVQEAAQTASVQDILPDDYAPMTEEETAARQSEILDSLTDADMPAEAETEYLEMADAIPLTQKVVKDIAKSVKGMLGLSNNQVGEVYSIVLDYSGREFPSREALFNEVAERFGQYTEKGVDEDLKAIKAELRNARVYVDDAIKGDITDYGQFKKRNFGKIRFSNEGLPVDVVYMELAENYPGYFPEDIINPSDQLQRMAEIANYDHNTEQVYELDDETLLAVTDTIINAVNEFKASKRQAFAQKTARESFNALMPVADEYAPPMDDDIGPVAKPKADTTERTEKKVGPRQALHQNIMDRIKTRFAEKGFDFDSVLKKAKNLSTFATVDNTPQRVMEKSLGYKEGQVLSDLTVDQVARNETEGIKWLNKYTDKKNGLLAQISKQYNIKPGSKESAAAQMYAEGFYVAENEDIIEYGDKELAKDFPDARVQANIKGLAKDPRVRQIYDETLALINASRARNAYPEIQKLDNYFLHFRAMSDTFSRLGLPFNPNDIKAKDLPTDLNGVTADLKPGQPYFASAMHRKGQRTSFDLLGGLEQYLTSAKGQIYHIDDIQTLRALRNYIADTFGQAKGLEGLDTMTEEEVQERIKEVYGAHLSTFAKFLNEEANTIAGKTALIDRGLEGIIGRRGITFLDTVNRQVGANMVGYNVSSSLTNFLAPVQAFAKTNKADFVKAFSQTVYNKLASINGNGDGFAEQSPVMIRRKGADRFHRTFWQKLSDPGYALMGAVGSFSTELIARAKYNEFTRKGMDAAQAHIEADKWTSRLMGDRSLGQQPHLYNSKMLGIVTKFQLEVRNQLDSQFYDTIQEAKVSNEDIQNAQERNAKTAAKVASTFFSLAVGQHLFGKVFESIAGYNPAFDIIEALAKAFGWDDDEEDEDTVLDNIGQGFMSLMEDMPYSSVLTGGRIPIQSALPISEFFKGKDQYGNEKSRLETLSEAAPYYLLPGGYGQIKKTVAGLNMFSDEHPVAGSYTDSGNLRFPVEDTLLNRAQAAVFGQYASSNARDYFDNERQSLKKNQIQEFVDVDIPIRDYWEYRDGLKKQETLEDKFDYIAGLDLPISKKNILINNVVDRKEPVDLSDYDAYSGYEEFDFATKNPEKYAFFEEDGISYSTYKNGDDDTKDAYDWAYNNPDKYLLSKAAASDVVEYRRYAKDLYDIKADKDASGKTISGSRKEKVIQYLNNLDIDYGERLILFKSEYEADDTYNADIVEYLNGRDDISFEEEVTILKELGFIVLPDGTVQW